MENRNGEIHVDTDEARGGYQANTVRWVLGIGLALAIIGLSLAWIIPSLTQGSETLPSQNANVTIHKTGPDEGRDTDSNVTEGADQLQAPADVPDEGAVPSVEN